MLHGLFGTEPWFAPKKFGYGSGLPTAWQGWVLTAAFIALVFCISLMAKGMGLALHFVVMALLTLPFLWLVRRHTPGGWRWRNG